MLGYVLAALLVLGSNPATAQGNPAANAALCARLEAGYAARRAELQRIIPGQKREVDAWYAAEMARAKENSGPSSLLNGLIGSFEIVPPRVGAQYSTNSGALECLDLVFSVCPGGQASAPAGPKAPADVAAFNALAGALADRVEARADAAWQASLDLKNAVPADDQIKELRLLAKANVMAGFSTECQPVVAVLRDMRLPEPEPEAKPQTSGDVAGQCAQLLRDLPGFCVLPPGDGEEELHDACCDF